MLEKRWPGTLHQSDWRLECSSPGDTDLTLLSFFLFALFFQQCQKFGQYNKEDPTSFRLSDSFSLYPQVSNRCLLNNYRRINCDRTRTHCSQAKVKTWWILRLHLWVMKVVRFRTDAVCARQCLGPTEDRDDMWRGESGSPTPMKRQHRARPLLKAAAKSLHS